MSRPERKSLSWTNTQDEAILANSSKFLKGSKKDWKGLASFLKGATILDDSRTNIDVKNRYHVL